MGRAYEHYAKIANFVKCVGTHAVLKQKLRNIF